MEVFVRHAPERATEPQMSEFFLHVFSKLSIENWHCRKIKRKHFATLTFLSLDDGNKFLSLHGQVKDSRGRSYLPRGRTNLVFQGIPLPCCLSNKPPDTFALKSLEMDKRARQSQSRRNHTLPPTLLDKDDDFLECSSVSNGLWDYVGSNLVFTPYLDWKVHGNVKFGSQIAIIRLDTGQRIDIPYSTTQAITIEGLPQPAITITLSEAPQFFESTNDANDLARLMESLLGEKGFRQGPSRQRAPGLDVRHEKVAGSCLVYRIELVKNTLRELQDALSRARGIIPISGYHSEIRMPEESYWAKMQKLLHKLAISHTGLPFAVKFQVQKLAQNGYLSPEKVSALLPEIANLSRRSGAHVCANAVCKMFQQIPFPGPDTDAYDFELDTLISLLRDNEERLRSGSLYLDQPTRSENVVIIHRVTVTPAGTYLYGPYLESNNRVLRKYPEHHDYFIRVQFCDEDGMQVKYNPEVSNDLIYARFKKVLNEGIMIGGRQFAFLGFSHSSLRAQSCWFMAPFVHHGSLLSDRMLIGGLGDFSNIRCPAKCAARIGQAFSETPTAITLDPKIVKGMKDVERNGHVFSDGVGTVSMSVLEKIWDSLPVAKRKKTTLFQIRYSGAKGMIALDSRLQGDCIFLRDSMIKFPGSDSTDIEICGAAHRPLPLFLNHQVIKILEDMGVEDDFFLYHQAKEVERLRMITSSPINASIFLRTQSIGELIHLPWFINQLSSTFQEDDFLQDVLEIAVLIELRALKHKARIPVQKGYTLHGIMDETGVIEENHVFCIVEIDGKPKVITGKDLIITRSPALHKGDVQIVTAVTVPDNSPLMQLRNCICFSQKGSRDIPSKLSGGDLDGDLYQIIFDPKARAKTFFPPAEYRAQPPLDLGRPVERQDMTEFFVTFMATDQLGRIATLHKVLADQRKDGVLDCDCLVLAEMHSTAVDFSKSGIPVTTKMPKYSSYRPDFMAPGPHVAVQKGKPLSFDDRPERNDEDDFSALRYYESDKILGKLYRAIDEREVFGDVQRQRLLQHLNEVDGRRSSISSLLKKVWGYVQYRCQAIQWEHQIDRARGIRDEYEYSLLTIVSEYSPRPSHPISELEVFVGNILGKTGAQNKRQRELSISMKESFTDILAYTVNCIMKDGTERSEESLERSIACFKVSMEDRARDLKVGMQLVSFRYVAAALCLKKVEKVLG